MVKLHFTEENMPRPEEFQRMLEEAIVESNPVDELIELSHELYELERRYGMSSAKFYEKYREGELGDDADIMHWAIVYASFLRRKQLVEAALVREAVWRTHETVPA